MVKVPAAVGVVVKKVIMITLFGNPASRSASIFCKPANDIEESILVESKS